MLPPNIRVDMNCQPTWVTQNAIPGEHELGHYDHPPPDKLGLKHPSQSQTHKTGQKINFFGTTQNFTKGRFKKKQRI